MTDRCYHTMALRRLPTAQSMLVKSAFALSAVRCSAGGVFEHSCASTASWLSRCTSEMSAWAPDTFRTFIGH